MEAKRRSRSKMNIPMCVACVLLCLTMFTIHLMSGLYAKYTVKGEGGDGARVAKIGEISVVETGDIIDGKWIVSPGVPIEKDARVIYTGGEVAVYIFLEVDVSDNWTVNYNNYYIENIHSNTEQIMNWYLDPWKWDTIDETEKIYCYTYEDTETGKDTNLVKPNMPVDANILKQNSGIGGKHIFVASDIPADKFAEEMSKTYISFKATVVQAGEFENAEAAWASVSSND